MNLYLRGEEYGLDPGKSDKIVQGYFFQILTVHSYPTVKNSPFVSLNIK